MMTRLEWGCSRGVICAVTSKPLSDDIVNGNVAISPIAASKLRELLAIPDITAEEAECVRLERELEQARADGVIDTSQINPPSRYRETWKVGVDKKGTGHLYFDAPTKLEALRAAVARVRELRAEAERAKLPEPGEMALADVCAELRAFDYRDEIHHRRQGPVTAWCRSFRPAIIQGDNETPGAFHRRALTEARKLDGAA